MSVQEMIASGSLSRVDARYQLHDFVTRWCHGIDSCDRDVILSANHPHAWDDDGIFAAGLEAFADCCASRSPV